MSFLTPALFPNYTDNAFFPGKVVSSQTAAQFLRILFSVGYLFDRPLRFEFLARTFSKKLHAKQMAQSLIYSFVARDKTILAEYSAYVGNFNQIAAQCLERLPADNKKSTYSRDGFTFNFSTVDGFSKT